MTEQTQPKTQARRVSVTRHGAVAVLTLNAPPVNALSAGVRGDLWTAIRAVLELSLIHI